jgi:predicted HTH transcriptional regulator
LVDSRIFLHIFDDRLEVISPGALLKGIALDNARFYYSKPRNDVIARVLCNLRYANALGSGIPRIIHLAQQNNLPSPDFEATDQQFLVRVWAPQ